MKILIVEDDANSRTYLELALRSQGYSVESAANGVAGLEQAKRSRPDLIISDILMPEMDGFELCRRVKTDEQFRSIPFVFYTATYVEPKDEKLAMALGASRFLIKPMEPEDFFRAIKAVIDEHQARGLEVPLQPLSEMKDLDHMQLEALARKLDKKVRELEEEREALRETEQRFAAFMLNLPAAAWIKDTQGQYVYANAEAERVFSLPLTAMRGKTDDEIFPPETARQFRENDQRALAEGVTIQTTDVLRQADGIDHYSIVNKFALAGPDGKPAYVAGVALDITERKRMEAELERFASFPLLDPTPIIEMDSDGRVTFCNRAAEKMLGKVECLDSSNPLIPRGLPDILRDLHEEKARRYHRTVEMGELVFDEMIYLAPQFNSVRIFAMDITERRRCEEDRNRLAAIVESSDDAIVAKTLDGVIADWNKGAEKLFGYTASEIKGRHISTLVPADRVDKASRILEKIGRGENVEPFETTGVAKDGRQIPVLLAISPIRDMDGRITGASTIAHDITERKRAEQALRETEQKLRNIVEYSTNLFYVHGTDHVLTYVSPQSRQFIDCDPEEAMVRWPDFITDNPVNMLAIEATQRAIDTGERQPPYQMECIGRTGRKVWVEVNEAPIIEGGRTVAIVGSLTDITERKRAEEKIAELNTNLALANRALEAFNYTVAHDLRKPLTVVNSYCQALKELCGEQLDVDCKAYVQGAYDGTLRMNRLIDALLNFSRMAHVELRRETVDLSGMAQVLAAELRLAGPGRRVDFRIADGVSADGDAALLRVVLENLLGNAWKYTGTRDEGIIEFGTTEIDGKPAFFVRDNGAGFDMVDADKLFTPFQRLPGAKEFRGHGIGLATVERIISRHGGRVWAEAKPGKGATFYFTLANGRA